MKTSTKHFYTSGRRIDSRPLTYMSETSALVRKILECALNGGVHSDPFSRKERHEDP